MSAEPLIHRPDSACVTCSDPIRFERGLIFGVCERCWDAALATPPALGDPAPSCMSTSDEPLGTCTIHGDYWTDDCTRCGR